MVNLNKETRKKTLTTVCHKQYILAQTNEIRLQSIKHVAKKNELIYFSLGFITRIKHKQNNKSHSYLNSIYSM